MKKAYIIAEKFSLLHAILETSKKHQNELDYEIEGIATVGHVDYMKLPREYDEWNTKSWNYDTLPIFPDETKTGWKYGIIPNKNQIFEAIKEAIHGNKYDFIIHCGDADQEGQILVDNLLIMTKNTLPVKRFWQKELTDDVIFKELKNLKDNNDITFRRLYEAGMARSQDDYVTGMNASTCAGIKFHAKTNIGRVMSPSLHIMSIREKEIKNYKKTTSYQSIEKYDGFTGVHYDSGGIVKFATKKEVIDFNNNLTGTATVINVTVERNNKKAPRLFVLSELQAEAAKYGIGLNKATKLAQELYEKGYITYPRTDCSVVGTSTVDSFPQLLKNLGSHEQFKEIVESITPEKINAVRRDLNYVNDKEIEEEGNHTAIIPTSKDFSSLSGDELTFYMIVAKRFVSIFMPPQIKEKITIITKDNGYEFKTIAYKVIAPGYTILYKNFEDNKDDIITNIPHNGDTVKGVPDIKECTSSPPKRFTDSEFVKLMDSPAKYLVDNTYKDIIKTVKGIGTQSTRAEIIKKLARVGYIRLEPVKVGSDVNYIYVTDIGMKLIDMLEGLDIINVDMTAKVEEKLDMIRRGTMSRTEYVDEMKKRVLKMNEDIKNINSNNVSLSQKQSEIGKCPKCAGSVIECKKVYACINAIKEEKTCDFHVFKTIADVPVGKEEIKSLLLGKTIKKKIKKESSIWEQQIKLIEDSDKCFNYAFVTPEVSFVCPKCRDKIKLSSNYFMCSKYKNGCDFIFKREQYGAKFSEKDMIKLINGGSVKKEFTWKNGKSSENTCHLEDNKLKFDFTNNKS